MECSDPFSQYLVGDVSAVCQWGVFGDKKKGADELENDVEAVRRFDEANIFHDIVMLVAGQHTLGLQYLLS